MAKHLKVFVVVSFAALVAVVSVMQYRHAAAASQEAKLRSEAWAARDAGDRRLADPR